MGDAKSDEDFKEEIQDIRLIWEMGAQTWIGKRSIRNTTLPNMFMIKPILEDVVANQEDPINCQDKILKGEVVDDFLILKKRRWLLIDKITCWELVAKAQMMVDIELVYDTKVTTNDDNVGEGGE